MKDAFYGLISRLDMAEGRNSDLESISIESSKTSKQREQRLGNQNNKQVWDNYKRNKICKNGMPKEKREKGIEKVYETIVT